MKKLVLVAILLIGFVVGETMGMPGGFAPGRRLRAEERGGLPGGVRVSMPFFGEQFARPVSPGVVRPASPDLGVVDGGGIVPVVFRPRGYGMAHYQLGDLYSTPTYLWRSEPGALVAQQEIYRSPAYRRDIQDLARVIRTMPQRRRAVSTIQRWWGGLPARRAVRPVSPVRSFSPRSVSPRFVPRVWF